MKKTQQKNAPKETTPVAPSIDDFFTQFLDKRQKNYTKKLDKINELGKKKLDELTPEQQDLVQNKHLTLERIKYFDDIKELYSQAHSKKEQPVDQASPQDNLESLIGHALNLYFTGNVLQHLTNTSQKAIESTLSHQHQTKVGDIYGKVFHLSHTHESLESAKNHLADALNELEFINALNNTVTSKILEKHQHAKIHEVLEQVPEVKEVQPILVETHLVKVTPKGFMCRSDDEEEDEVAPKPKHHQKQKAPQQHHNEHKVHHQHHNEHKNEIKIVALPEDKDDGNEDWIRVGDGNRGVRRGGRGQRGGRGGYRHHEGDNQNEEGVQKRHYRNQNGEHIHHEGNDQKEGEQQGPHDNQHRRGRGGYRGRPRNEEHRDGERGDNEAHTGEGQQRAPQEQFARTHKYNNNEPREGEERGQRRGGRGYRGGRPQGEGNTQANGEGYKPRGENRGRGEGNRGRNQPRNQDSAPQGANQ